MSPIAGCAKLMHPPIELFDRICGYKRIANTRRVHVHAKLGPLLSPSQELQDATPNKRREPLPDAAILDDLGWKRTTIAVASRISCLLRPRDSVIAPSYTHPNLPLSPVLNFPSSENGGHHPRTAAAVQYGKHKQRFFIQCVGN